MGNIEQRLKTRGITLEDIRHYAKGVFGIDNQDVTVSFFDSGDKLGLTVQGQQVSIWGVKHLEFLKFVGSTKVLTNFSGSECPHCGCDKQRYRLVLE